MLKIGLFVSVGTVLQLVSQFLLGLLIARSLGPADYGQFILGRNILVWATTLAPLGLDLAMLKYAAQYGMEPSFWHTLSRLRALVGAISVATITIILLSGIVLGFDSGLVWVVAVSVVALPFASDASVLTGYFRGMGRPGLFSVVFDYAQSLSRLLIGFVLYSLSSSLMTFVVANASLAAFVSIAVAALALFIKPTAGPGNRHVSATAILNVSPWLAFSMVCFGLFRVVDLIVLGNFATSDDTGRYAAVASVAVFVQIYPMTLALSLGPELARLSADTESIVGSLRRFLTQASVIGSFVYGGIATFGTHLDLVFGDEFHFDPVTLLMLSTAWLISGVMNPTGLAMSMTGRHKRESLLMAAGAIALVIALVAMVPPFGVRGAAAALLGTMAFTQAARAILVARIAGGTIVSFWDILPPIAALALSQVIDTTMVRLVDESWIMLVAECAIYSILYLGTAAILKSVLAMTKRSV